MLTLPNAISFFRVPLAFLFILENTQIRIAVVFLAMITDWVDGYIARRNNNVTKLGSILDPLTDKFFVFFVLSLLFLEHKLELWQALFMISRDFSQGIFASYLIISKKWNTHKCNPVKSGKVSTALQFFTILGVTLNIHFPYHVFWVFVLLGILTFVEFLLITPTNEKAIQK